MHVGQNKYGRRGNNPRATRESDPLFGHLPTCAMRRMQELTVPTVRRSVPMRWMPWIAALGATWILASPVTAIEPFAAGPAGPSGHHRIASLCGPPCSTTPGFHPFFPSCCEDTSPCCDNAWEGYCEEKARCRAHWYRAGPRASCRDGAACVPCSVPEGEPSGIRPVPIAPREPVPPALPVAPLPLPRPGK